ncbi:hypothetical protein FB451DRAFT_1389579 [Mycena latifolia]|nr:hypothetical protein FB451DRAFT_1389579 [Mycena latifolia]
MVLPRRALLQNRIKLSKLFNAFSLPVLYRTVHLRTYGSAADFYSAVLLNTALAEFVRSFTAKAKWRSTIEIRTELEAWPLTLAPIPLPHLEHLRCPLRVVPSITTNSSTEAWFYRLRTLDNPAEPNEVERTFAALKLMIRPDVPFICPLDFCEFAFFPEIVDSISRNISHTRTLHYVITRRIKTSRHCLPRFTGLGFLSLGYGIQDKLS